MSSKSGQVAEEALLLCKKLGYATYTLLRAKLDSRFTDQDIGNGLRNSPKLVRSLHQDERATKWVTYEQSKKELMESLKKEEFPAPKPKDEEGFRWQIKNLQHDLEETAEYNRQLREENKMLKKKLREGIDIIEFQQQQVKLEQKETRALKKQLPHALGLNPKIYPSFQNQDS